MLNFDTSTAFNFDLSNGYVILRIICGFFLIPHAVGKFTAREASFGFFRAAGLKPAELWVYSALIYEVIAGVLLILGLFTQPLGWLTGVYLLFAAAANYKVSKKWLWHIGGSEWPVFWGICCMIVGAHPA